MAGKTGPGRHRLGRPGLVHCVHYRPVADALAGVRHGWWRTLLTPAAGAAMRVRSRHSLAGLRRRAAVLAMERAWAPAIG